MAYLQCQFDLTIIGLERVGTISMGMEAQSTYIKWKAIWEDKTGVRAWMSNYIPMFDMDLITYSCQRLDVDCLGPGYKVFDHTMTIICIYLPK